MFRLDGHTLNSFMQSFDEYDIQGICKGTERRIADKEDGHNVSDAIFSYASSSTLTTTPVVKSAGFRGFEACELVLCLSFCL